MATIKGWAVFAHPLFLEQVDRVSDAVEHDRAKDPAGYLTGGNAKLALAIRKLITDTIPSDPASPSFRQGNTLGPAYRHWFRAKFGNGRYRLFYRYSAASKVIIYAWVNDEQSLRTYGSRSDAYAVFKGMLDKGNPPDDWTKLLAACDQKKEWLDRMVAGGILDTARFPPLRG